MVTVTVDLVAGRGRGGGIDTDAGRGPGRGVRLFVAAFLGLFLITGLVGVEAWPLTGWRLYSRLRHGDFWAWQVLAVGTDGSERPVDLRRLPAGYHGVGSVLSDYGRLPAADREVTCRALGLAARAQYPGVAGVAVDHVLGRIPPLHTALTVVASTYFFTGLRKLMASGLAWVASDNMRWILYAGAQGKAKVPEVALFIADRPWLAHLAAAGVMAFELSFPLLLLHRRAHRALVGGAFVFHGVTWLTLGLDYWKYAFVVVLLLVDWAPLVLRLRRAVRGWCAWSNRTPTSSTPSSA